MTTQCNCPLILLPIYQCTQLLTPTCVSLMPCSLVAMEESGDPWRQGTCTLALLRFSAAVMDRLPESD